MKKLFLLAIIAIAAAVNANAQSFHGNGVSTYVDRSTMWERAKNHRAVINDKSRDIFIGDKNGRKEVEGLVCRCRRQTLHGILRRVHHHVGRENHEEGKGSGK